MGSASEDVYGERLDEIIRLLRHLVALELSKSGVNQQEIGKHLGIAKATVGKLLQGLSRE